MGPGIPSLGPQERGPYGGLSFSLLIKNFPAISLPRSLVNMETSRKTRYSL